MAPVHSFILNASSLKQNGLLSSFLQFVWPQTTYHVVSLLSHMPTASQPHPFTVTLHFVLTVLLTDGVFLGKYDLIHK